MSEESEAADRTKRTIITVVVSFVCAAVLFGCCGGLGAIWYLGKTDQDRWKKATEIKKYPS